MTAGALSPLLGEFQIHTRDAPKALHLFVIRSTALQCSAASGPGKPESRLHKIGKNVQNQVQNCINLNKYGIFVRFFGGISVSGSGLGRQKSATPLATGEPERAEKSAASFPGARREAMGRVLLRPTPLPETEVKCLCGPTAVLPGCSLQVCGISHLSR